MVTDPWRHGELALAFFKVSCPVCQMVTPKIAALAEAGVKVLAVGQDPVPALRTYRDRFAQTVPTVSEPPPYPVSSAYGITSVPTLFLVASDGVIRAAVGAWDRDAWNSLTIVGGGSGPISKPSDGLPAFRPG